MEHREYTRRATLRTIGLGAVGAVPASTDAAATTRVTPDGRRDDERIQFVEADPEAGFNYPYWLATPETFRSEPVPLLVTMNSAKEGQPLAGGGPDKPPTVAETARTQVQMFEQVGPWVSEQLGVPHLVPVFPLPDGDPVDDTHKTILLDRETMLIEGTDLERIDLQLLRMTEHARQDVLTDHEMHDRLLFWGNSSGGVTAEHMAVLHPGEIMAFAGAGINGIATLPFERLDDYTLKYPVGVADLEAITGDPFNAEAFDEVDKFYIQGGRDTHNRLKFNVPGELPGTWADPEVYATAKAVYGRDMVEDRLPRCHIAFEKAGISGQFRVYPEMAHDPERTAPDVLEFHRRSIEDEDASEFGQSLTLPLDRTVDLKSSEPRVGDQLHFTISGEYPPTEGLVTYTWQVDEGRSRTGQEASFTFEGSGTYDLSLTMETAHGQFAQRGMSLMADGSTFGAFQYAVDPPRTEILVEESITIGIDVTNVGAAAADRSLEFRIDGELVGSREVALDPDDSMSIAFEYSLDETGEAEVRIPPAYRQTISVTPKVPDLVFSGIDLSTTEAVVGEPVRVTAEVKNAGTGPGKVPVTLEADGESIANTSVSLAVNETRTVSFDHVFETPGDYELVVNDTSIGTVSVEAKPTPTSSSTGLPESTEPETHSPEQPSARSPGFGVLAALAGLGSVVSYFAFRNDSDDE